MLRLLLRIAVALVLLLIVAAVAVYGLSERRLGEKFVVAAEAPLVIAADSAAVERGRHLFTAAAACSHCHGADASGNPVGPANPVLNMNPPNLTRGRGGIGDSLTPTIIEQAVRHGVKANGHSVLVMPSDVYSVMSDADVAAIVAFLGQVPPVDHELPPSSVGPIGRALMVGGQLPVQVARRTTAHTVTAAVSDSGRYLARISGCFGCHGEGLSGGKVPGEPPDVPPSRNLTPTGLGSWKEADFVLALREGKRPDGTTLDRFMPWESFRHMSDAELHTLWQFLQTVPPKPTGTR